MRVTFVESQVFTKRVALLGLEEPLHQLQKTLLTAPDLGDLDPGTGGLRKIRMPDPRRGKGKRSGVRVHYLWLPHVHRIYLLFLYRKGEATVLTREQKGILASVAHAIRLAARGVGR